MKKILNIVMVFISIFTLVACHNNEPTKNPTIPSGETDFQERTLKLWYDEEAPKIKEGNSMGWMTGGPMYNDDGWTKWSLPLGNGYFGANVFGRLESERIQITEKTLSNPWEINGQQKGGLNNFSETYIDFNHSKDKVKNYERYLDLNTAISGVLYDYNGVKYTREYFTSYPDKSLVIYLDSSKTGALNFTLRPTIPYEQDYMVKPGDKASKTGDVISWVENDGVGVVELSGTLGYYDVDFYGLYHVYTEGGKITASQTEHIYKDSAGVEHCDTDGTIVVEDATKAFIVVNLATDYELTSEIFTASDKEKPTFYTTIDDAIIKVEEDYNNIVDVIDGKDFDEAYNVLKSRHLLDYKSIFNRVDLNLGYDEKELAITTDVLVSRYQTLGQTSLYLENLLFQYGRYLIIQSSRRGTLPANLQGAWNCYNIPPWSSGYWHNINVQMNYWPAFTTNIAETFEAYVLYNEAYMEQAEKNASNLVGVYNPSVYDEDGGNGWTIGVAGNPFFINSDRSPGNMGFSTQLYWDYYRYTLDENVLKQTYKVLANAARYITKCVVEDEDGNLLVEYCDSPEQYVNGAWYYTTGTTYAQSFAYLNNYYVLQSAKELGINLDDNDILSDDEYSILKTIMEQLDKYDPINVGLSGQIKEFREEKYYGDLGDPSHRHVSQLVGLYPGNLINSTTPAWLDAAKVTLEGRGSFNERYGWVYAHKMGLYARVKDDKNAYDELQGLIRKCIFPNLWTSYDEIYQAEANFGLTAGIAEMLLQSHEGYIEVLPALPIAWSNGSYKGLVAEGNFEVDVTWSDMLAKEINITSNKGGVAKVYYPSITKAKVVDSKGFNVSYEVVGQNLIAFETKEGENYIITGFEKQEKVESPSNFKFERLDLGDFEFSFDKVENADSYNIYKAVGNDASYTLIGNTKNNKFSYKAPIEEENLRTTFAVTALKGDIESNRSLCYFNPIILYAVIEDVTWSLNESNLNIEITATSNAYKYRLYEKSNNGNYVLVLESSSPNLSYANYSILCSYAVSTISTYENKESPLYDLKDYNILNGKKFIPTNLSNSYIYDNNYIYSNLTDGIFAEFEGRFSTKVNNSMAEATVDLEGVYSADELRIYVYAQNIKYAGEEFKIEVYSDGIWETIVYYSSNSNLISHVRTSNGVEYLGFDLDGKNIEKIRFYIGTTLNGFSISFYEIECYGYLIS